ncbi:conserved hypothetical protein [Hyella patelloides LEGE 07179]|uniref:Uncharacterized protein n=1 Tax=Hyella patelloides LEGE 07179 TaxID=945734 RepID=A0A563VTG4_9CYAN|nr:hypothetical protein [Hyella patelloides]VEP14561.1 conserved hypothetical protein [Hyella patelloides LEGE 07179]
MIKLISIILLVFYFGGVWKFWKGFNRTNFDRGVVNKLLLASLWPVLLITNKSYRRNFQKALKG